MRRFNNEFGCNKCDSWVPYTTIIAETNEEYEKLKSEIPTPFAEWNNGDITKQFECRDLVKNSSCTGKINITYLKKDIRTIS